MRYDDCTYYYVVDCPIQHQQIGSSFLLTIFPFEIFCLEFKLSNSICSRNGFSVSVVLYDKLNQIAYLNFYFNFNFNLFCFVGYEFDDWDDIIGLNILFGEYQNAALDPIPIGI